MTPLFTAGTRPSSIQSESGLFTTDFSVKPQRTHDDVMGVPVGGTTPEFIYTEAYGLITDISISGTPILTSGAAFQGIAAIADAATLSALANLIDNEVFGLTLTTGTLLSRDPEFKKARSGTGREFTFNLKHSHAMV